MILPGTLALSVIRGIAFDSVVLRCADDSVSVTGTLSPDVTGTYVLSGQFAGRDLYILAGAPSTFLYFNGPASSYVIARLLTTAALTDYWVPAAPITFPSGTYVGHGANTGNATADDHTVDLTGFTPKAEVRRSSEADVTLDLNPSVTDAVNGEITIPSISSDDTQDFDFKGSFNWDLVLVDGGGERSGPYVKGPFTVSDNITHLPPT